MLTAVAVVVALCAGSVFLLAYFSPERATRPAESWWRALRNGLRRRQHHVGPVDVSLAELFQSAEPDDDPTTPFAAFDQVRQRAVEQAARAAGLAAALMARERNQVPEDPLADLFPEPAEPRLVAPGSAEAELADGERPTPTDDQDVARRAAGPDAEAGPEPAERERVGTP